MLQRVLNEAVNFFIDWYSKRGKVWETWEGICCFFYEVLSCSYKQGKGSNIIYVKLYFAGNSCFLKNLLCVLIS